MSSSKSQPKLIHESLNDVSQSARFLANGVLSQVLFMTGYNASVAHFEPLGYPASTIYAIFYLLYIPVGHALGSLFVFGWPDDYFSNLAANAPIGLTAMAIGTMLTGFLSNLKFDALVEDWKSSLIGNPPSESEEGEFYASLVVMVVTGVWCYVLSMYVNSSKPDEKGAKQSAKDPAKEL